MRALWLPTLAALSLTAACATVEKPAAPAPIAAAEPSAPQPIAGYDWHLNTSDGAAQLAFGVAESDDLKLGFHCDAGSGRLDMTAIAPSGTRTILLESGGDTERFPATAEPSEVGEGDLLTASTDTDAPVFKRFRQLGWIALWTGDQRETLVPHPGSENRVDRFFALCD